MNSLARFTILLFIVLGTAAQTCAAAAGAPPADAPAKIVCPGLKLTVRPEDPSGPGIDDYRFPELVLVVRKIALAKKPAAERPWEPIDETPRCDVKRVLYGSYAGKTVRFRWPGERVFRYWGEGEFVVALIPAFYKEQAEYTAFYGVPASDERAEAALCQARLDYAALVSDFIFVGKEVSGGGPKGPDSNDPWNQSSVEVVRVIQGPAMQPGTRVRVSDEGLIHITNYHRRPPPRGGARKVAFRSAKVTLLSRSERQLWRPVNGYGLGAEVRQRLRLHRRRYQPVAGAVAGLPPLLTTPYPEVDYSTTYCSFCVKHFVCGTMA